MQALSIIIPCHNEAVRLPVENLKKFLQEKNTTRLILIDDGSTDTTREIIVKLQESLPSRIKTIFLDKKSGKAEAVRIGMLESIKDKAFTHHGFIDADLAVPMEELHRLYEKACSTDHKFVFGSRVKKIGATIIRNEWRHFYSRIIATIVGSIIKLDVYDTQCSAKIFTTEIVNPVFENNFHTRWLFDVEIICRINKLLGGLNEFGTEEPLLSWKEMKGSKLRWYNFFSIVKEVFILKKHYRQRR
jgi:dolichyl-phosphate beta-glucosyltransferase